MVQAGIAPDGTEAEVLRRTLRRRDEYVAVFSIVGFDHQRAARAAEDRLVAVPILRAGLGMLEGVRKLIPGVKVGHLGFYRNEETLEPVRYYGKLPPRSERSTHLLLDPMLGTGGTAAAAVAELKAHGASDIRVMCVVASPEGAAHMTARHPDVPVYAAALDRQLNAVGYIVPGLGDAGDRVFGTS